MAEMGSKNGAMKLVDSKPPSLASVVRWRVAVGGSAITGNKEGKEGRAADKRVLVARERGGRGSARRGLGAGLSKHVPPPGP